jgi:glutamate racemase
VPLKSTRSKLASIDINESPIGVFDSGVGGLSVLRHIRDQLPHENLVYVADSAYAPYGSRSSGEIQVRSLIQAEFLVGQGAKALVVACNTASASAATLLRERYSFPIVAMEPAVKPAVETTRNGIIGVLATSGTLKSVQFAALLESYGKGVQIITKAGVGLVECVERGDLDSDEVRALLRGYLTPMLEQSADTLVLGCTHYPFLRPMIEQVICGQMSIIDTGAAVASHLRQRIEGNGIATTNRGKGEECFWTSGCAEQASDLISRLWGGSQLQVSSLLGSPD